MRRMHEFRWTKDIVRASLLGGALLGCRSRARDDAFLATRVPVARLDSVLEAADSVRLSLADARTLLGIVADAEFAAKLPHDTMTIAELLAWGRTEHARMERAAAETTATTPAREEARKQQLDSLLTVTL